MGHIGVVIHPDEPAVVALPAGIVDLFLLDPSDLLTSPHGVTVTVAVWSGLAATADGPSAA